jgi:hypothetical protein
LTLALINNLKACSPAMHQLFMWFKEQCSLGQDLLDEDIEIASGKRLLGPGQTKAYLKNLVSKSENICHAFKRQVENAAVRLRSYL